MNEKKFLTGRAVSTHTDHRPEGEGTVAMGFPLTHLILSVRSLRVTAALMLQSEYPLSSGVLLKTVDSSIPKKLNKSNKKDWPGPENTKYFIMLDHHI